MAVAAGGQPEGSACVYEEIVNTEARGEILGESLDTLLTRVGATLDDVKRVMVTLGPGSFSGLRTGVAFCQGLCFSGMRELYGVTTLQALACFAQDAAGNVPEMTAPAGSVAGKDCAETAVVIRARTGFWYLRLNGEEFFIETPEVIARLKEARVKNVSTLARCLTFSYSATTLSCVGRRQSCRRLMTVKGRMTVPYSCGL